MIGEEKRRREEYESLENDNKRARIRAQRKFAQGSTPIITGLTVSKERERCSLNDNCLNINGQLSNSFRKPPKTEDFLTFLCFRGTPLIPRKWEIFNYPQQLDFDFDDKCAKKETEGENRDISSKVGNVKSKAITNNSSRQQSNNLRKKTEQAYKTLRKNKITVAHTVNSIKRLENVSKRCSIVISPQKSSKVHISTSTMIAKKKSKAARLRSQIPSVKYARMLQRLGLSNKKHLLDLKKSSSSADEIRITRSSTLTIMKDSTKISTFKSSLESSRKPVRHVLESKKDMRQSGDKKRTLITPAKASDTPAKVANYVKTPNSNSEHNGLERITRGQSMKVICETRTRCYETKKVHVLKQNSRENHLEKSKENLKKIENDLQKRVLRNRSISSEDNIQGLLDIGNTKKDIKVDKRRSEKIATKDNPKNYVEIDKKGDAKCSKSDVRISNRKIGSKDVRRNSLEFLKIANKKLPPDKLRKIRSMDNLVKCDKDNKILKSDEEGSKIQTRTQGVITKLRRGSLDSAKEIKVSRPPTARPSRKTKTVASLYLEILSKKLNLSEDEEIDDSLTLSSLPDLRSMAVQNSSQTVDLDLKEFLEDYKACSEDPEKGKFPDKVLKSTSKVKRKDKPKDVMPNQHNKIPDVVEMPVRDPPNFSIHPDLEINSKSTIETPIESSSESNSQVQGTLILNNESQTALPKTPKSSFIEEKKQSSDLHWSESVSHPPFLNPSYTDKLTKVLRLVSNSDPNWSQIPKRANATVNSLSPPTVHSLEPEFTTIHIERPLHMDPPAFKKIRKPMSSCHKLTSYHNDLQQTVLAGKDPMLGVIPVNTETLVVKVPPEEVLASLNGNKVNDCSTMYRSVPASKITVLDTVTATATSMVVNRGQDLSQMFDKKCSKVLTSLNMVENKSSLGGMTKINIEVIKKAEGISVIKSKDSSGFMKNAEHFVTSKVRTVDTHVQTTFITPSSKNLAKHTPFVRDCIIKEVFRNPDIMTSKNSASIAVQVDPAELDPLSELDKNLPELCPDVDKNKNKSCKGLQETKTKKMTANLSKDLNTKFRNDGTETTKNTQILKDGEIVEGPVFKPTEDEFQDPIRYIEKIWSVAEPYGICKVIPPSSFKSECNVNDEMRFTAYNHYIHKMFHRWGTVTKETAAIQKAVQSHGIELSHTPWVGSLEIDLTKLYHTVQSLGGLKSVIEKSKWNKVADIMKIPKSVQDRVSKLDDIYCKYLLPYAALTQEERKSLLHEVQLEFQSRQKQGEVDECVVKGRNVPLSQFYRMARNTQSMWFRQPEPAPEDVESLYWKIVTSRDQHVCVHAGSIDSGFGGYGFPCNKQRPISKHPWNLKVLSSNAGSILRCIGPVMGVTIPTIHVGMLFSSCCWYRDPHCLPWIEYLHTGAPKIWYSVPHSHSLQFHEALTSLVPDYCHSGQIWLASDTTMVPPSLLVKHQVKLTRIVQEPGEYIIVFPKSFTSAICTGYLVAESVYFALKDCLPIAKEAFQAMSASQEPSMFPWEKLIFSIAKEGRVPRITLEHLLPMITEILARESTQRQQFDRIGVASERLQIGKANAKKTSMMNEEEECEECRQSLHISMVLREEELL